MDARYGNDSVVGVVTLKNRQQILVVEDNQIASDTIRDALAPLDVTCTVVQSGEAAVECLCRETFDAVVLDLKLPGIGGLEALAQARARVGALPPVVVMTGLTDTGSILEAGRQKVFHYLTKNPLDGERLKDTIVQALRWKAELNTDRVGRCFKFGVPGCLYRIPVQAGVVFVAMPFTLEDVYQHGIRPAIEAAGMVAWRADEHKRIGDITCKICGMLQACELAVMDITGLNANVMLETGLAFGFGKRVILLKRSDTTVPSDLAGLEYADYRSIDEVREKVRVYLERRDSRPGTG